VNAGPQAQAPSILIVDDDDDMRNLLTHLLKREGYEVLNAIHGEQAMSLLAKAPKLPSLILLDLRMPVMDGWKFRTVQRADKRYQDIPVVVVTSVQTAEKDMASIQASAFLKKPIETRLLLNTVRTHIQQQKKAA
jgi:DNA-binding response OmpR family regulator